MKTDSMETLKTRELTILQTRKVLISVIVSEILQLTLRNLTPDRQEETQVVQVTLEQVAVMQTVVQAIRGVMVLEVAVPVMETAEVVETPEVIAVAEMVGASKKAQQRQ
jgi:hypothetical protein